MFFNDEAATMANMFDGRFVPKVAFRAEVHNQILSESHQGKLFFAKDRARLEMAVDGEPVTAIYRHDKGVVWYIHASQKAYSEVKVKATLPSHTQAKSVGREEVNGTPALKCYVRTKTAQGQEVAYNLWLSKDNIGMRYELPRGIASTELKNLEVGNQSGWLFELPLGYRPLPEAAPVAAPAKKVARRAADTTEVAPAVQAAAVTATESAQSAPDTVEVAPEIRAAAVAKAAPAPKVAPAVYSAKALLGNLAIKSQQIRG